MKFIVADLIGREIRLNRILSYSRRHRRRASAHDLSLYPSYTPSNNSISANSNLKPVVSRRVILGASSVARALFLREDGLMGVASNGKRFVLMRVTYHIFTTERAGNVGNKLAGGILEGVQSPIYTLIPSILLSSFAILFFSARLRLPFPLRPVSDFS